MNEASRKLSADIPNFLERQRIYTDRRKAREEQALQPPKALPKSPRRGKGRASSDHVRSVTSEDESGEGAAVESNETMTVEPCEVEAVDDVHTDPEPTLPHRRIRTADSLAISRSISLGERSVTTLADTSTKTKALRRSNSTVTSPSKALRRQIPATTRKGEFERAKATRDLLVASAESKKVFTIYGRHTYVGDIREGLVRRGWVERPAPRDCDTFTSRADLSGLKVVRTRPPKSSTDGGHASDSSDSDGDDSDGDGDGTDTDNDDDGGIDAEAQVAAAWKRTAAALGTGEFALDESVLQNTLTTFYPNFIWSPKQSKTVAHTSLRDDQQVNAFRRNGCISTKVGLTRTLRDVGLFDSATAETFYPTCFNLADEDDREGFLEFYLRCSAVSVLRMATPWSVPPQLQLLAIELLEEHVAERQNDDIDTLSKAPRALSPADCHALVQFVSSKLGDTFEKAPLPAIPPPIRKSLSDSKHRLSGDTSKSKDGSTTVCPGSPDKKSTQPKNKGNPSSFKRVETGEPGRRHLFDEEYVTCVHAGTARLKELIAGGACHAGVEGDNLAERSATVLEAVAEYDPQSSIQGVRNVWVVKPGAKSRGRGIFCENRLDLIMEAASNPDSREKYVAQKYIETPLIVHRTKFDIRQYFLVTSWNPLTVFFYKRCYLRFSSTEYDLTDIRSAQSRFRHLCNNAIQKDSGEAASWNEGHMWTSDQFKEWLEAEGDGDKWDSVIYPGMKEAVNLTCKAAQEKVWQRKGSFELFGADFIIDADFRPWLIEINTSPSLDKSTPATSDLVSNTLEDLLKVVVDRRRARNPKHIDTGDFELLMRQQCHKQPLNTERLSCDGAFIAPPRKPNCGLFARVPGVRSPVRRSKERRSADSGIWNPDDGAVGPDTARVSASEDAVMAILAPYAPPTIAAEIKLPKAATQSTPTPRVSLATPRYVAARVQRDSTAGTGRGCQQSSATATRGPTPWQPLPHTTPLPRIFEKALSPDLVRSTRPRSLLQDYDDGLRGITTTTITLGSAIVPKARLSPTKPSRRRSSKGTRRVSSKAGRTSSKAGRISSNAGHREVKLSKIKIQIVPLIL